MKKSHRAAYYGAGEHEEDRTRDWVMSNDLVNLKLDASEDGKCKSIKKEKVDYVKVSDKNVKIKNKKYKQKSQSDPSDPSSSSSESTEEDEDDDGSDDDKKKKKQKKSKKKQKQKVKKKPKESSSEDSEDSDGSSAPSVSSIRTTDSYRTKAKKVEHFILKYKILIKNAINFFLWLKTINFFYIF